MPLDNWIVYAITVLALMSTPGPSHLLMLSNSMAHGFKPSLATAAGDLSANLLQMLAAGLGLAAVVLASRNAFLVVKWLGVAYLIWLGIKMIRGASKSAANSDAATRPRLRSLWLQGFLTSATNPKAVVFFAALFPQFISHDSAFWPQFTALSLTYLIIDGTFLTAYGAASGWIAKKTGGPGRTWLARAGGVLVIVAAILLGYKTLQEQP